MASRPRTQLYTDGACSGNPGPGGWAWISPVGPFAAGFAVDTTNQRMELQAVLEGVRANEGPLEIFSDSTYVVNCFRDRWWEGWLQRNWLNSQKKPVANRDLWEPLISEVRPRDIQFTWVKGHAGDEWNELADRLAVEAGVTQQQRSGQDRPIKICSPEEATGVIPGSKRDPTGREPPEGYRIVILGLRPKELGGTGASGLTEKVRCRLAEIIRAKKEMFSDLVVLSGVRLGSEMLGAEAAFEAEVPLVVVLPYPDPQSVWQPGEQSHFQNIVDSAAEVITLQNKVPKDKHQARGALGRRDAWFARIANEAIIVWDASEPDVGRAVRLMQDALGELNVWLLDVSNMDR